MAAVENVQMLNNSYLFSMRWYLDMIQISMSRQYMDFSKLQEQNNDTSRIIRTCLISRIHESKLADVKENIVTITVSKSVCSAMNHDASINDAV